MKRGSNLMSSSVRGPTVSALPADNIRFAKVVEQARIGDELAFDRLFQQYNARICTYLGRMVGNDEEGRDLAQETFIKAWQALASIKDETYFDTWLYRIATNVAIDHLRRRKFRWLQRKNHEEDDALEYISGSTPGPEEQFAETEQMQQALAQVSLKYRSCLLLQLIADLTQREIAASLHISEKSVSIYVSRGIEQLRQAYERLESGRNAL